MTALLTHLSLSGYTLLVNIECASEWTAPLGPAGDEETSGRVSSEF